MAEKKDNKTEVKKPEPITAVKLEVDAIKQDDGRYLLNIQVVGSNHLGLKSDVLISDGENQEHVVTENNGYAQMKLKPFTGRKVVLVRVLDSDLNSKLTLRGEKPEGKKPLAGKKFLGNLFGRKS